MKKRKKTRWSINLLYNLNKKAVNPTRIDKSSFTIEQQDKSYVTILSNIELFATQSSTKTAFQNQHNLKTFFAQPILLLHCDIFTYLKLLNKYRAKT